MKKLLSIAVTCKIWRDTRGQELIEWALLGGFIACAAGTIAPGAAGDVIGIFGKVLASLSLAGGGGGDLAGRS
jgi:Flp pilus assembly pilin Flp